jgi:hypothetical protein
MCGKCPTSKSGNPRWILWAKLAITDEQREILREKSVEIVDEGTPAVFLIATTDETAQWLKSQDWVRVLAPETFYGHAH